MKVETPLEAIKGIRELKPDAVILDIRLKEGSGFDVLLNIKAKDPSPVVIMFTNFPYSQYRKKSMELGADYFFDKSTEFNEIAPILKKMIQDAHRNHPAGKC
jgi:DNA-binding NarL/FixJ family response regulator